MVTYKPYSIVVVPFPFTDKMQTKRRPALVISQESHQEQTDHVTLLMITSAKHSSWESDYTIIKPDTTGLSAPSIIRQKLFTIDLRLVRSKIGTLSRKDKKAILTHIQKHLCMN